ncbi:hypothetical protein BGX34_005786, partial [Mortierella sp. NVP85]
MAPEGHSRRLAPRPGFDLDLRMHPYSIQKVIEALLQLDSSSASGLSGQSSII